MTFAYSNHVLRGTEAPSHSHLEAVVIQCDSLSDTAQIHLVHREGGVFMAAGVRLNFHSLISVEEMEEYPWCVSHAYMVVLGTCMVDVCGTTRK